MSEQVQYPIEQKIVETEAVYNLNTLSYNHVRYLTWVEAGSGDIIKK